MFWAARGSIAGSAGGRGSGRRKATRPRRSLGAGLALAGSARDRRNRDRGAAADTGARERHGESARAGREGAGLEHAAFSARRGGGGRTAIRRHASIHRGAAEIEYALLGKGIAGVISRISIRRGGTNLSDGACASRRAGKTGPTDGRMAQPPGYVGVKRRFPGKVHAG